jgi:hypothetical protein
MVGWLVKIALNIQWKKMVVTKTGALFRYLLRVSEENHIKFREDIRLTGPGSSGIRGRGDANHSSAKLVEVVGLLQTKQG